MATDDVRKARLRGAFHAISSISRLSSDEDFNRAFGRALEAGDAKALGEMLEQVGVEEVQLSQIGGQTAVSFNAGILVCVTVTIQVCREF
jgi:hypothetical protein